MKPEPLKGKKMAGYADEECYFDMGDVTSAVEWLKIHLDTKNHLPFEKIVNEAFADVVEKKEEGK